MVLRVLAISMVVAMVLGYTIALAVQALHALVVAFPVH